MVRGCQAPRLAFSDSCPPTTGTFCGRPGNPRTPRRSHLADHVHFAPKYSCSPPPRGLTVPWRLEGFQLRASRLQGRFGGLRKACPAGQPANLLRLGAEGRGGVGVTHGSACKLRHLHPPIQCTWALGSHGTRGGDPTRPPGSEPAARARWHGPRGWVPGAGGRGGRGGTREARSQGAPWRREKAGIAAATAGQARARGPSERE